MRPEFGRCSSVRNIYILVFRPRDHLTSIRIFLAAWRILFLFTFSVWIVAWYDVRVLAVPDQQDLSKSAVDPRRLVCTYMRKGHFLPCSFKFLFLCELSAGALVWEFAAR